jgi:hypothetical protein
MDLFTLLIVLVVVGLALWAINAYLAIPQPIKGIIMLVVVLMLCLFLLQFAGIGNFHIGGPRG